MIIIVDFGSQTTHLIARRIKELGISTQIVSPEKYSIIKLQEPDGIILSGGPSSVYEKGAPTISPSIFSLGIPILGICYGFQLMCHLAGGKVVLGRKEYGPARISIKAKNPRPKIAENLPEEFTGWMSHGDEIVKVLPGMKTFATTPHMKFALAGDVKRKLYGIQFHPEVEHTENGMEVLRNFIALCEIAIGEHSINSSLLVDAIKETVGDSYVLGAVSGGVDSTVAAVLTAAADKPAGTDGA